MKDVDVGEFVPNCLEYLDEVEATGVTINVLQNGRSLVRVAPDLTDVANASRAAEAEPPTSPGDPGA